MTTLETLIRDLTTDAPRVWRNVHVVTIRSRNGVAPPIDYILAADAFDRGLLSVTEVDQAGAVNTLRAENRGDVPVLLLEGEELRGAKQNRILNCDVLLRPHGTARLPVSCVEAGRWDYQRPDFVAGEYSPARLRSRKSRAVHANLEAHGAPLADQHEVWQDVAELLTAVEAESGTAAMSDAVAWREDDLHTLPEVVPPVPDATGVLIYIDDRFAGLDVFDQPQTLRQVWSRLLTGYALDAVAGRTPPGAPSDPQQAAELLAQLGELECRVFAGVDLGEDWRIADARYTGSALVLKQQALHLSVFPAMPPVDEAQQRGSRTRIAGPSRRGGLHPYTDDPSAY